MSPYTKQYYANCEYRRYDDWRSLAARQKPVPIVRLRLNRYINRLRITGFHLRILRHYGFTIKALDKRNGKHAALTVAIGPNISANKLRRFYNTIERTPSLRSLWRIASPIAYQEKIRRRSAKT